MVRVLFLNMLMGISCICFSQNHTNNWYFGKNIGLNFNQDPPGILSNGMANSVEGSATISDNNGDLLFYTNGNIIINKEHLQMKNGNNILGNLSSTCNTVVVPLADSKGTYFLFTVGAAGYDGEGFRYTIIDMNKDNGLGEVVLKNAFIEAECYEKIAAVRHCNKRDVWVTVRKWDSDEYHSYLVTSSGVINTPVISHTGLIVNGYVNNALGSLKFSPDGSKLAAIHSFENNIVELMNFNNITGVISGPVIFKPNAIPSDISYMGIYGTEFSPNGQLLYVSANNSVSAKAVLYQFDISSMNASTILSSKQLISETDLWRGGALQVGPDQKIYFTMWNDSSLSVIENPDVYGMGCNFQYHKIFISNYKAEPLQFGLPVFIAGDLDLKYAPFDFSTISNCTSFNINFKMNKTTGVDSVLWDFGDGNKSTDLAPTHTYSNGGNYNIKLTIYKTDCGGYYENIIHTLSFDRPSDMRFLSADTTLCEVKNFLISATVSSQSYLWSTGASGQSITVNDEGEYWVEIKKNGCTLRDSFKLKLLEPISVSIGSDTNVCVNKPVILDAGINATYLWNTGATGKTIEITKPGLYIIKVKNNDGCSASDSVLVTAGDCKLFIPSAFTPNNDGINDEFSLSSGIDIQSFTMNIYNRYGQVVFNSKNQLTRWDGRFKGDFLPMGLYPWLIVYKKNGVEFIEKGTVMLIR